MIVRQFKQRMQQNFISTECDTPVMDIIIQQSMKETINLLRGGEQQSRLRSAVIISPLVNH